MKVNAALFALCAASALAHPTAISTPDAKAEVTAVEPVSPDYKSSQYTSSTAVPVLDVAANDKVPIDDLLDHDDYLFDWADFPFPWDDYLLHRDDYLPDWADFNFTYHNYSPKYLESLVDHDKYPLYLDDPPLYQVPHTGEEAFELLMSPPDTSAREQLWLPHTLRSLPDTDGSIGALLRTIANAVAHLETVRGCIFLPEYPFATVHERENSQDGKACLVELFDTMQSAAVLLCALALLSDGEVNWHDVNLQDDVVLTDLYYKPPPTTSSASTPMSTSSPGDLFHTATSEAWELKARTDKGELNTQPNSPPQETSSNDAETVDLERRTNPDETEQDSLFFSIDESTARLQVARLSGQATIDTILDAVFGAVEEAGADAAKDGGANVSDEDGDT
jgi:hypothetical protein